MHQYYQHNRSDPPSPQPTVHQAETRIHWLSVTQIASLLERPPGHPNPRHRTHTHITQPVFLGHRFFATGTASCYPRHISIILRTPSPRTPPASPGTRNAAGRRLVVAVPAAPDIAPPVAVYLPYLPTCTDRRTHCLRNGFTKLIMHVPLRRGWKVRTCGRARSSLRSISSIIRFWISYACINMWATAGDT